MHNSIDHMATTKSISMTTELAPFVDEGYEMWLKGQRLSKPHKERREDKTSSKDPCFLFTGLLFLYSG